MPSAAKRSRSCGRALCPFSSSWSKYASPTRLTVHSTPPHSSSGRGLCAIRSLLHAAVAEPAERRQRLRDDLVHVVVAVGREPPHEHRVRRRKREPAVALVQLAVLRP